MGFLKHNLLPFFKKRDISFIESLKESEEVYSFLFEKEKDVTWNAGQYGLFTITHQKIKNGTRPFTVASAPAENRIRITTTIRESPSEFKKALFELKPGMKINMRGPVGPFYLKDNSPSLFIAGGIGITPFRSIIKQLELEGRGNHHSIQLLYLDSNKSYLFQDELDRAASKTSVGVTYLDSREDLQQEIETYASRYKNELKCFVAGPKSMVESILAELQNRQIPKRNMIKDAFFGY